MKTSSKGIELIKKWEGCRLTVYKDAGGIKTIGWGHAYWTGADTITQAEADVLLLKDIEKHAKYVDKYQPIYGFNQNQYDALVSFAFNVGSIDGLTAKGTRTFAQISEKLLAYDMMAGRHITGLKLRRQDEKRLFDSPMTIKSDIPNFEVGKKYKLLVEMRIRKAPALDASLVGHYGLSADGKKHDADKDGALDKNTIISCLSKVVDNKGNIWIKCPSGWLCAYDIGKDKIYLEVIR